MFSHANHDIKIAATATLDAAIPLAMITKLRLRIDARGHLPLYVALDRLELLTLTVWARFQNSFALPLASWASLSDRKKTSRDANFPVAIASRAYNWLGAGFCAATVTGIASLSA